MRHPTRVRPSYGGSVPGPEPVKHAGSDGAWASAQDVLCVRLDALGDVLMSGPAMRALAAGGRRITLLTSLAGAQAAALMPEVAATIVYDAPWMKAGAKGGDRAVDLSMIERLAASRFDGAVIFTVYSQSSLPAALLCRLAGVPLRLAHCRENPYALLTDWVAEPEPQGRLRHEVRRQLDLVASVGARVDDERLAVRVPEAARARTGERLAALGLVHGGRWAVVHPGATAPSRRYPREFLRLACATLAREHDVRLLFTGGSDERSLVDEIRAGLGPAGVSLAGQLSLAELAALLREAPLLVAANTGPVHLAAALGTPVLDLYALTNPQHTPWAVPSVVLYHDVPCRWCYKSVCPEGHHLCLRGVRPEEIVRAALALLEDPAGIRGAPWTEPLRLPAGG